MTFYELWPQIKSGSVAKRIFEKLIDSKLDEFKGKLQSSQGGFLKIRSTLHRVYFIMEIMRSTL